MGKTDSDLTGPALKEALWDALKSVRTGALAPAVADSMAAQAREIIRTGRLQLMILAQAQVAVPQELIHFAAPEDVASRPPGR